MNLLAGMMEILRPVIFLCMLLVWRRAVLAQTDIVVKPGCPAFCGGFSIPYPFGTGEGCYKDAAFKVLCQNHSNTKGNEFKYRPYLELFNTEVIEISFDRVSVLWKDLPLTIIPEDILQRKINMLDLKNTPFTYSDTHNRLVALSCDLVAYISNANIAINMTGCVSICGLAFGGVVPVIYTPVNCESSIPKGLKAFDILVESINRNNLSQPSGLLHGGHVATVTDSLQMVYGFRDVFTFEASVSLDWVIGQNTCKIAQIRSPNFACRNNTYCVDSTNGPGYRCHCLQGFYGNPYLPHGCQDINECEDLNKCLKEAQCVNRPGNYSCQCPPGYIGDGTSHGIGCLAVPTNTYNVTRDIGVCISSIVLFGVGIWSYRAIRKRSQKNLKLKFFKRNGGLLLKQQISSRNCNIEKMKIFVAEELEKATDNFSGNRILGQGGFGTVYKGMLRDGRIVAIKKSQKVDANQTEQFINELVILSQINHRNIVKIFGCCLETEVPLLVYEFIGNGTLSDHLHKADLKPSIPWKTRLQISIEVARALTYLHSLASVPIFHRDVKSSNILLDSNYKAKVSDFGLSRTVPLEKSHLTTKIEGTFGYLDPEYFHSGKFTEKSDVYGFGVILVELLTGKRSIFYADSGHTNLSMHFISALKENSLFQVLDGIMSTEATAEEVITIAELAKKCLKSVGKKRPTMKQVTNQLEDLQRLQGKHIIS